MTSGVLFLVVGQLDDNKIRYKIFELFQVGTDQLFKLTDLKFKTSKDNTIWFSYSQIAPLVNLLSSVIWTGIVLLIIQSIKRQTTIKNDIKSDYWKKVFFVNLTLSLVFITMWSLMDLDFIYSGVYSESGSILNTVYSWLSFIAFFPSIISDFLASVTLDQGGDTIHGNDDMYLVSKTSTAFALTLWSIIGVFTYGKIKKHQTDRINEKG